MKTSLHQSAAAVFSLMIVSLWLIAFVGQPKETPAKAFAPSVTSLPITNLVAAEPVRAASGPAQQPAPFVIRDTGTDSPGTNIVTRIVTFTALIGGTPRPALQWKADRGNGFVDIAGATNASYRIGNAQVSDSGFYELVATNSAGSVHTTPQQLVVTEGED